MNGFGGHTHKCAGCEIQAIVDEIRQEILRESMKSLEPRGRGNRLARVGQNVTATGDGSQDNPYTIHIPVSIDTGLDKHAAEKVDCTPIIAWAAGLQRKHHLPIAVDIEISSVADLV
jgi:hypothetical protein